MRSLPFRATVAASQPRAVQAGLDALRNGGSAVDAALAAAITLTVVEPTGNGIGSDAFAWVWDGADLHGFNGSGRSPKAWNPGRFSSLSHMPELGWDAVTVPGAVDAWARLSTRFGLLPFPDLFRTAIACAREGFEVTPHVAAGWARSADRFRGFPEFVRTFLPAPKPGDRFRCPALAETLEAIAASGGEALYRGDLASRIAAASAAEGGAMTLEDLQSHRGEWVSSLSQSFGKIRLHELPPNTQGLAALGVMERLPRRPADSPEGVHLQVEAMRAGFGVARRRVADPGWLDADPASFLEDDFLDPLARGVSEDRAGGVGALAAGPDTVCLAAADEEGRMVSFIQSNYRGFGSGVVVPGTGISLQNRGCGFTLEPGHPNRVGGGKRPFHTLVPGFVTEGGAPAMAFAVMGGPFQPQGHLQMVLRVFGEGQDPQAASDAPRWSLLEDGRVALEAGMDPAVGKGLRRRGHALWEEAPDILFGGAQMVQRREGGYRAGSDRRKDGLARGVPV